jgi:hypothetical protein
MNEVLVLLQTDINCHISLYPCDHITHGCHSSINCCELTAYMEYILILTKKIATERPSKLIHPPTRTGSL